MTEGKKPSAYNFVIDPAAGARDEHVVTLEDGPVIEKRLTFKEVDQAIDEITKAASKYDVEIVRVWMRGEEATSFVEKAGKAGFVVIELRA